MEAYAADPPKGEMEQHIPPEPDPPPAPQIWNLAQVIPSGTLQLQSAP